MPVLELTQDFIDNMVCPVDRAKVEYRDTIIKGLMINLTRNGHGSFVIRYRSDGKYQYLTIGSITNMTLDNAMVRAKELLYDVATGKEPEKRKSIPTFKEFFEERYMPYVKPRKRSAKNDQQLFETHLCREFGHLRLDKIKIADVEEFHMKLHKSGLAPSTSNHYVKLMRHCLNKAVHWDIIKHNQLTNIQLLDERNTVENFMDETELNRMLMVLNTHENRVVSNMLLFMLNTGCRRTEAFTVKWEDIDLDKRVWLVRADVAKSGKRRSIPISDSALNVINALDTQGKFEYLFINKRTGDRYKCIKTTWNKIRIQAGVPHVRLHDLRHQFASLLVNGGRSLYETQMILGHTDPKVTMRYAHLQADTLNEAVNSISDKLTLPSITASSEVSSASELNL